MLTPRKNYGAEEKKCVDSFRGDRRVTDFSAIGRRRQTGSTKRKNEHMHQDSSKTNSQSTASLTNTTDSKSISKYIENIVSS